MIQVDEWSFRCSKCDWTPDRTSKVHPGTQTRWHIDGHQSDCLTCEELRAELLALRQQLGQAEQRIEEAFRAGYHCRWHKEVGAYCFDPTLSPGDPEGAFAAWLAARLPAPHGCPPEKETP